MTLNRRTSIVTLAGLGLALAFFLVITFGIQFLQAQPQQPGGTIAYTRGGEIRLINANGSNDRRIWITPTQGGTKGIQGLEWRPNGAALAFASDYQEVCSYYESDIFTINADGSNLRRITNSPACGAFGAFPKGAVNVDVQNLTLESGPYFLYVEGAPEAIVISVPPGATSRFTVSNVADLGNFPQKVMISNGASRWLDPTVTANVVPGNTVTAANTFVLSAQGNVFQGLGATQPAWKRDGSTIGFVLQQGILSRISSNPPIAGDSELLTQVGSGADGTQLAWSPTSDDIAYTGFDSINLVRPGANNPGSTLVTKDGTQLFLGLDWFPDGRTIVFGASGGSFGQENSNLYLYNIPDDVLTPVTNFSSAFAGSPSVSPDGQYIAFAYSPDFDSPAELRIIRRDGTGMQSLGVQGNQPDWKPGSELNTVPRGYLPMIADRFQGGQPPSATQTPNATPPPSPTNTPAPTQIPVPALKNGNFEAGPNGVWSEFSDNEIVPGSIILEPGGAVVPRSGKYVAWLGGVNNATNEIQQLAPVTSRGKLYLRFWYQIQSGETIDCESDVAGVIVNDQILATYGLCADNETNGWVKASIDLSDFSGEPLTLSIGGVFDGTVLSSFFVDDVSLGTTP